MNVLCDFEKEPTPTRALVFPAVKKQGGTSLVAQWLRICLPMQGTWVRSLIPSPGRPHMLWSN